MQPCHAITKAWNNRTEFKLYFKLKLIIKPYVHTECFL